MGTVDGDKWYINAPPVSICSIHFWVCLSFCLWNEVLLQPSSAVYLVKRTNMYKQVTLWPKKPFISPSSYCKNYFTFITLYTGFRFPTIYLCCLMFISTIGGSSNLFAAKYTKDSFTLSKSIYMVLFFDSLVTSLGFVVIQGMLDF